MATVLQQVQTACQEANIPSPASLVGATDASTLQLYTLYHVVGKDLRSCRWWPQLKRPFSVVLQGGRRQYQLPLDYYSAIPSTWWDPSNNWAARGPLSDGEWAYRVNGFVTVENRKAFRVFGPDFNPSSDRGQLWIDPIPSNALNGQLLTFEYISKSWLLPPNWGPSTTYAASAYANVDGNIYKVTAGGGGSSGTVAPNMAYGVGQDGGVFWRALTTPAWGATTYYVIGDYVTNGGNLYVCTVGGKSAGAGGPTGTDTTTAVTDSTVSWLYCSTPAWVGVTAYAVGAFVKVSSTYYLCVTAGTSGKNSLTFTATTVVDNALTWTFQNVNYEVALTDSDTSVFDDELMILGCKARFMQARGLGGQDLQAEFEAKKTRTATRFNPGQKISMGSGGSSRSFNIPEGTFNSGSAT